jgi:rhodanese-related sulfurtransferase
MAAYTAENRISGFSPSVTVTELDAFIEGKNPIFVDVRDVFAFEKSHIKGAIHIPLELLSEQISTIPTNRTVIVYDETGKKGHQALRTLLGAGFKDVTNISGGHTSLQRQARTVGFKHVQIDLLPVELKSLEEETAKAEEKIVEKVQDKNSPIVVDVRTPEEFEDGAYPEAVNIPLDELQARIDELGSKTREITLYCASGARSAYAQRFLQQMGFANATNGGGIAAMMSRLNTKPSPSAPSNDPIVVDVRTSEEFEGGAYPSAINIPLDELQMRIIELGSKGREITLYCASGARSAYGQRGLLQMGFTNVKNGGGIMQMMRRR